MAHIFISYSKVDIAFAEHLQKLLENVGFQVWRDARGIDPSDDWWETIVESIDSCGAFVIIMTPESEKSDWVKREILRAERKERLENKRIIFSCSAAWRNLVTVSRTPIYRYDRRTSSKFAG